MRRTKLNVRREKRDSTRTCVGCRKKADREELERFVFIEGRGLIHDVGGKLPGRGVWAHSRRQCMRNACEGGFSRGLKRRVSIDDVEAQIAEVEQALAARLQQKLDKAFRAGQVVIGPAQVQEAMKQDALGLLVLATDAEAGTEQEYWSDDESKPLKVLRRWAGSQLGQMAGREFISIAGIVPGRVLEGLMSAENRRRSMSGDDG